MITLNDAQRSATELAEELARLSVHCLTYEPDALKAKFSELSGVAANIAQIVGENLPLEDAVLSEPGEFAASLGDDQC